MTEATEIVFLKLKEGVNPEESGSPAAQQLKKCATTLSEQPGYLRSYWGLKIEDPSMFIWTIDWNDVQAHKDFVNAEAYKPFTSDLAEIFDFAAVPPFFYHVNFTSDSKAAREAPVTEFCPFNLPADASDSAKSDLEDKFLTVAQFASNKATCSTFAAGWVIEELDHPQAQGGKAKRLQGLLGWPSVEDHMKCRDMPEFGEILGPMRSSVLPPVEGQGMFHAKLHGKGGPK